MIKEIENKELLILSPFELPDVRLAVETIRSKAFPVLHLGRDIDKAKKSLEELSSKTDQNFGVCIATDNLLNLKLPDKVTKVIIPYGKTISVKNNVEILFQVHSLKEAKKAIEENVSSLVIKGIEGAGKVAKESSFVLFQGIIESCRKAGIKVYIQGGAGIHSSAAFLALGAQGIIFDSQIAAFPECSVPKELKELCTKLNGNEITEIDNFNVLVRRNSPKLPENPCFDDLRPFLNGFDISANYLPMGQDIILSADFYRQYKKLRNFVYAFYEALHGHIIQAKKLNIIGIDSPLAKELGTKYPVSQGPMARISDVPEFIKEVADAGALPFLALSVMEGKALKETVKKTAKLLGDKSWGISLLGFVFPEMYQEQAQLIVETKPKVVLISGGHGILVKQFENAGIKTFIHAPSVALMEQYIREGITNVIFEGRESGGHIGPYYSTLIWEKQVNRLLQEDELSKFSVLFAGGIHDALSSAFVSIMSASLAAKGVKIGIQMGTSYLYTKEILKTGAITPLYHKMSIENSETVCLESVPGQVNRILPSPFMDYFFKEKQRILSEGTDTLQTRIALENLNVGRLRIAAKGVEMQGQKLVALTTEEQYEKGMYMIGDVSILINKLTTLKKLHKAVAEDNKKIISEIREIPLPAFLSNKADIAVIGMECIFPEATNIEEYWLNIVTGKDCITEVPDIRWNKSIFYKQGSNDCDYITCKTGGFVPEVDFNPMEFGLTPQSLASIEPLQLLSLLVAKRALENAGYGDLTPEESENTSVIFGGEGLTELATRIGFRTTYRQIVGELPAVLNNYLPKLTTDTFTGILSNITPGRISNRLNLRGSNYVVSSACATGITTLQLACNELTLYDSDMVVLGGDDFHSMLNDYMLFSSTYALSPTGHCASFDSKADGMTLGEGVGVLILKRLEDAERAGDKIYAVIKGIGCSSDGKSVGLTAPNKDGQILAIQRAYREAGISPSEVGLIEAHGTGTVIGDRTELRSISSVFWNNGAIPGQTYLGTVKSQIGHSKCAAGMAGLIKAILSVYNGVIPPTIHLEKPLEIYDNETSPFIFNTQAGIWNADKRIAGISAFGFGGANGHAVIENYKPEISNRSILKVFPKELVVFRGDTMEEAKERIKKAQAFSSIYNNLSIKDLAYSLVVESNKPVQICILASSLEDLSLKVMAISFNENNHDVFYRKEIQGKTAFLFPGQGSQRINMARDLFVAFPAMRHLLIQNREYEKILFPHTLFNEADKKEREKTITDSRNAQPVLGIIDYAIAELLRFLEVEADMVAGHSYGEIPALCFAGVFDSGKLVELSRKRADSILKVVKDDTGKMIALSIPVEEINNLLKDEKEVWAVNFNSPKQTVLAGTTRGMKKFMEKLNKQNIVYVELNVACAFHSPLIAKAKEQYSSVLKEFPFNKPELPVWSNTTAGLYPENRNEIKKRMSEQLIQPVLFCKEIEQMYEDGARIFIETGPGNVLTGLAKSILGNDIVTIQTEAKDKEGISFFLFSLAKYLSTGKTFNIEKLFEGRDAKFFDIDHPEKYRKPEITWRVNGQYARPSSGKLPDAAGILSDKPLDLKLVSEADLKSMSKLDFSQEEVFMTDKVMLEYLGNIRSMNQVMLSYFGQNLQEVRTYPVELTKPVAIETNTQLLNSKDEAQTVQSDSVEKPPAKRQADLQNMTTEYIKEMLLNVVSEKTGYPVEMLSEDLNLDLESDLSIDSIKRLEIIGDLKDKLNLGDDIGNSEEMFIKMSSLKSLNELIAWIEELNSPNIITTSETVKETETVVKVQENSLKKEELSRMVLDLQPYPLKMEKVSIEGKRFAVLNGGGKSLKTELTLLLENEGAQVELIQPDADITPFDGLILLNITSSNINYTIYDLFKLINGNKLNHLKWLFTFSDITGKIKSGKNLEDIKKIQGFSGLLKTLRLEYPEIRFRSIISNTIFDKKTLSKIVLNEITDDDFFPEVIYNGNERFRYNIRMVDLILNDENKSSKLKINNNSVIIVTGGAQGIAPELVSQLAAEYPCHYLLVGRSKKIEDPEGKYAKLKSQIEIRKHLITIEGMKVPAEIEKKIQIIYKSNQIKQSIERIEKTGAKVSYHSVDITNSDNFRAFLQSVRKEYGKIDGIIHSAGLLNDKLFADKTWESFEKVYQTKVNPLHIIFEEIIDDLKLLVLFSSVSSSYGNIGQSDYAAANSVFDITASLNELKPDLRIVTFNWGPWKGAGMVSESLEAEFVKRGIPLIPLKEGGAYFVKELKYGKDSEIIVMGGRDEVENFFKDMN